MIRLLFSESKFVHIVERRTVEDPTEDGTSDGDVLMGVGFVEAWAATVSNSAWIGGVDGRFHRTCAAGGTPISY